MTRAACLASRGSPGLGVSGRSPRAPARSSATTAGGNESSPPNRASRDTASPNVLGSATVGPDPMRLRSSPTTSETASVSTGAAAAAASCPPLMADRCLRTVFSSSMPAPARSRRRVVWRLSSSVMPALGAAINEEAPPESSTRSRPSRDRPRASASARRPASTLRSSGTGWLPSIHAIPGGSAGAGAGPMTSPAARLIDGVRASAAAIGADAFPTLRTCAGRDTKARDSGAASADSTRREASDESRAARKIAVRSRRRRSRPEVSSRFWDWTTRRDSSPRRIA